MGQVHQECSEEGQEECEFDEEVGDVSSKVGGISPVSPGDGLLRDEGSHGLVPLVDKPEDQGIDRELPNHHRSQLS